MKYYSAVRKKKVLSFVITSMKLKDIKLSEIGQTERQILYILYTWNLKRLNSLKQTRMVITRV